MLQCEECKIWFHDECVAELKKNKRASKFVCPNPRCSGYRSNDNDNDDDEYDDNEEDEEDDDDEEDEQRLTYNTCLIGMEIMWFVGKYWEEGLIENIGKKPCIFVKKKNGSTVRINAVSYTHLTLPTNREV